MFVIILESDYLSYLEAVWSFSQIRKVSLSAEQLLTEYCCIILYELSIG